MPCITSVIVIQALCHLGLSYPDVLQSVIDKVTIKGEILQSSSSKVLQYNITLLAILAKRTKNRTMFIQVKQKNYQEKKSFIGFYLGYCSENECTL